MTILRPRAARYTDARTLTQKGRGEGVDGRSPSFVFERSRMPGVLGWSRTTGSSTALRLLPNNQSDRSVVPVEILTFQGCKGPNGSRRVAGIAGASQTNVDRPFKFWQGRLDATCGPKTRSLSDTFLPSESEGE